MSTGALSRLWACVQALGIDNSGNWYYEAKLDEPNLKSVHCNYDGTRVVTLSENSTANVWILDANASRWQATRICSTGMSLDGTRIISCSPEATVIWRFCNEGWRCEKKLEIPSTKFCLSAFNDDGTLLFICPNRDTVIVWDLFNDGWRYKATLKDPSGKIRSAYFIPQGTNMVTITDKVTRVWEMSMV